jgi:hypothetical protein
MVAIRWLAERDPSRRTSVEISVSSGEKPAITAVGGQLTELLRALNQEVFVLASSAIEDQPRPQTFPFLHEARNPSSPGLLLRGDLAEGSCDAIGWVAEVISDLLAPLSFRSPLLLTVARV